MALGLEHAVQTEDIDCETVVAFEAANVTTLVNETAAVLMPH